MDTPPVVPKQILPNSLVKNSLTPCRRVGLGRPSSGTLKKLAQVGTNGTPTCSSPHIMNHNSLPAVSENKPSASDSPSRVSVKLNYGNVKEISRVRRCLTQNLKSNEFQSAKRTIYEDELKSDTLQSAVGENCDLVAKDSFCTSGREVKKLKSELTPLSRRKLAPGYENKTSSVYSTGPTKTSTDNTILEKNEEIPEEDIVNIVLSILEKKKKLEQVRVQETYAKKHNLDELRVQSSKWRSAGQEALRHCMRLARQAGYTITMLQLMKQHGFPPDLMGYNAEDDEFE